MRHQLILIMLVSSIFLPPQYPGQEVSGKPSESLTMQLCVESLQAKIPANKKASFRYLTSGAASTLGALRSDYVWILWFDAAESAMSTLVVFSERKQSNEPHYFLGKRVVKEEHSLHRVDAPFPDPTVEKTQLTCDEFEGFLSDQSIHLITSFLEERAMKVIMNQKELNLNTTVDQVCVVSARLNGAHHFFLNDRIASPARRSLYRGSIAMKGFQDLILQCACLEKLPPTKRKQ